MAYQNPDYLHNVSITVEAITASYKVGVVGDRQTDRMIDHGKKSVDSYRSISSSSSRPDTGENVVLR